MIALLVPFVAAMLPLALDASQPPDPTGMIQQITQFASEFTTSAGQLLLVVDGVVIDVSRLAYVTVILLGTFLYFTRLHRRMGKDLITGGVALAMLAEFVFPVLSKL